MIITDGSFSMDGDLAKLDKIVELAEKYDALVFVDDSHASGFIGKTGRGTHEHCGVMGKIDIITTTLGKALGGASGGCVSGRRELVEMCRQKARPYLFSNTIPPVVVSGANAVLDIISKTTERRDKLERNTAFWRKGLTEAGLIIKEGETPIVPVMLFNAKLSQDFSRDLYARRASTRSASSSRWCPRARRASAPSSRPRTSRTIWKRPWPPSPRSARSTTSCTRPSSRSSTSTGCEGRDPITSAQPAFF